MDATKRCTSSAPATTMRPRSGIASLVWWILRATLHFPVYLLLSADDQDNGLDSAMRPLAVAWAVQTTLPGLVYGKKYRNV